MKTELVEKKNLFSTPFWHLKMSEKFRFHFLSFLLKNFDFNNIQAEYNDANLFDVNSIQSEMNSLRNEVLDAIESQMGKKIRNSLKFERAWLCGTGSSYSLKYHNHSNSVISTVIYFSVEESRNVVFHDPRVNANRGYGSEFLDTFFLKDFNWQPSSGDLIIFPSFLYHSVLPNTTNTKRIAIAIDFFADT